MPALPFISPREDEDRHDAAKQLVKQLFRELHQAETSALKHCPREAARLGDAPAADVLRAIGDHAEDALEELREIARAHGLPESQAGMAIGAFFSAARVGLFDRLVPLQITYRGTLLGLHHCVDLVTLLRTAVHAAGYQDIAPWCERWLEVRLPLVEHATREVSWLAQNPRAAVTRPTLLETLTGKTAPAT